MARGPSLGRVTEFDEHRGLGTVVDTAGRALAFHCTAIADGSRRIDVGTAVCFVEVPTHGGVTEARGLTTV